MSVSVSPVRWHAYLTRAVLYLLLTVFAFLMIFPFIYMLMTSFKNSTDVFRFPPRLFPYSPEMRMVGDQTVPVYRFVIDGVEREMLLVEGGRQNFGFFTTEDRINVDSPRDSSIVAQVPLDQATSTDETVTVQAADGSEDEFDVYEVTTEEGSTQRLLLAYRGALDKFTDPDNPEIFTYAVERTAPLAEFIDFPFWFSWLS